MNSLVLFFYNLEVSFGKMDSTVVTGMIFWNGYLGVYGFVWRILDIFFIKEKSVSVHKTTKSGSFSWQIPEQ